MSAHPQPRLTPEQYLEIERAAEFRSEFYDGHMYAISGGSHSHALIIGNFTGDLGVALDEGPCLVTPIDLRVCVSSSGLYTYPDIVVVCGTPKYVDGQSDTLLNPVLIIEVLSPSTEAQDRGFKSTQYRKLESLQEYVLVSQDSPHIEVFRRQPAGEWLLSEYIGIDAACRLDSVNCTIPLARIYRKVTFAGGDRGERPAAGS